MICANSMHISTSKYCKLILMNWIEGGKKLTLEERWVFLRFHLNSSVP